MNAVDNHVHFAAPPLFFRQVNGRIALSTKTLEPEPGDMIKNPQKVYDMAEVS